MSVLRLNPRPATELLYGAGSIVVCYACGIPLYRLQAGIYAGEPMARSAWKYAPVQTRDISALLERSDLEPGMRAALLAITPADWLTHLECIPEIRPGTYADCPKCKASFVYTQTRENGDGPTAFHDKGYLVKLATIPPPGQARRAP